MYPACMGEVNESYFTDRKLFAHVDRLILDRIGNCFEGGALVWQQLRARIFTEHSCSLIRIANCVEIWCAPVGG